MKLRLYFKTPDVVDTAFDNNNLTEDERSVINKVVSKFVMYGELLTVDFDTEAETATVVQIKR